MPIEQMNISLPPRMARFIRGKVKAGEYTNASEVVRDAVRHLQAVEEYRKHRAALHAFEIEDEAVIMAVREGVSQLERGEYTELNGDAALKSCFLDAIGRGKARAGAQIGKAKRK